MNLKFVLLFTIPVIISCSNSSQDSAEVRMLVEKLNTQVEQEHYFKLLTTYEIGKEKLPAKDQLYFGALINQAFGRPAESNTKLDMLLKKFIEELNEAELLRIHKSKRMNSYNLYDYQNAFSEGEILINSYSHLIDSFELLDLKNDQIFSNALKDKPRQSVLKAGNCSIPILKDKMGLMNIPVKFDSEPINFLFDTGSSFSFMKRSVAEKYNLEIIDADIYISAATGEKVPCDLVVADVFYIQDISIMNAVFWILDDENLTLPQYDYSPNGAIGFNIIRAMEEVRISTNGKLTIPEIPTVYHYKNIAINDYDPLIGVIHENDTLPFYMDTGAGFSDLYKPFFDQYEEHIKTNYSLEQYDYGSLGGMMKFDSYKIDSLKLKIAESSAYVTNIGVHSDFVYDDPEKVYGNLGQDFIEQFDTMILSFKYSSMLFQ